MSNDKKYRTMKVWRITFHKLRILSALLDESIVSIVDQLVDIELEKAKRENQEGI